MTPAAFVVLHAAAIDYADDNRSRYTRGWNERFLEALEVYGLALSEEPLTGATDGRLPAPKPATTGKQYPWPSFVIEKP
jgi:hypothetical protein